MNNKKLAELQSQARIGGKGTPRRKVYKGGKPAATGQASSASKGADADKKIAPLLKKIDPHPLSGIDEVNMFRQDGKIIHFDAPKVSANAGANTFVINGDGQEKEISELFPGILSQLGSDSLANLRRLAEEYQARDMGADDIADVDDVPKLVETPETEAPNSASVDEVD
ncbi:Nascent polypeptide-associated complex subunit beta [Zancudomyces culisetae]|uniref:Nascent polypeptide-associated complex subunit beta n=1 Tax=Zancudomyces culisetae TaxID=1213189 RepID=A0A1R1PFC1_ZANCU|nr:Nascent polypeptide-associated complex subunit beta [Zancudomyces culisetae]|eukprot:OMH79700.1 Nascent polypeptide-associated complex subunit beta [Zancudomyces culisetae]